MFEVVVTDEVGTSSKEFLERAPLAVVDGVPFVHDKVLELPIVSTASVQAIHDVFVVGINEIGLGSKSGRKVRFGEVSEILCVEVAMRAPRSGHVDPKGYVRELLNDGARTHSLRHEFARRAFVVTRNYQIRCVDHNFRSYDKARIDHAAQILEMA